MLQIEKLLPTGIVLWCFLFPAICASSTLTGVRYSDHSGDSGTGTGEIQLAVRGRVYQLFYQKPYPQKFSNPACDDIGAIWSVEARLGHGHKGTLLSATCSGKVDPRTHGPWLVVRAYLQQMAAGSFDSSLKLLSERWRSLPSFQSFSNQVEEIEFSGYRDFGGVGLCLDVTDVSSSGDTRISAGIDCCLEKQKRPITMTFITKRNPQSGCWEIDGIDLLPIVQTQIPRAKK